MFCCFVARRVAWWSWAGAGCAGEQELALHDGRNDGKEGVWTSIDGVVYDITEWRLRHPGGPMIRIAAGREAATLLESYHQGAVMASVTAALQNKCPQIGRLKDALPRADPAFFRTVRERVDAHLKANGYTRTTDLLSVGELFVTLALYLVCTFLVGVYGNVWAAVGLGVLTGRLGFIMHSGNHLALSSNTNLNRFGGAMMDLIGSTHLIWAHEHQVAHHMDPNVLGKDNDCEIGNPHVRFHPAIQRRWYHRFNHIVTITAMSIGFFKWYLSDPFHYYTGTVGHVDFNVTKDDWVKLAVAKVSWFILHVALPLYFTGPARTFALLALFMVLGGYYLESIFIVNHIQQDLVPPTNSHWANKQVLSTANWGSGSHLWNFVSGGLNHQIEHHLFPSYSIYLYPVMSPVVKQTCEEFGLPYQNFKSFPAAYMAMVQYLKDLGTDKFDAFKVKEI